MQDKIKRHENLLLGCIYRNLTENNENTLQLVNLMQEVEDTKPGHLLIVGDIMLLHQHITEFT